MQAGTTSRSAGMATGIEVTNILENQKRKRGGESLRNIHPPNVLRKAQESWGLSSRQKGHPVRLLSSAPSSEVSVTFSSRTDPILSDVK